ncbi:branched-chain amino acid ABC transporter permease [bacterium]|nr:branched-chain amino acid ABC transporter permease [bacterium]
MDYLLHIGIIFLVYAILGVSLNLVVGYTGLLSVTHAAFYGIGAYATALLLTNFHVGFFISLVLAICAAAIAAFLIGIVLSRFRGDYYALVSLGFNVIVFSVLLNAESITRGPLGIPGIPRPELFGIEFQSHGAMFVLALVLFAIVYGAARFLVRSDFGRALRAIREDEEALLVFGYHTRAYKLFVFVAAAAMASVAGSLFAVYVTFIDPKTFALFESIFILSLIILGGLGSLRGAVVGAFVLILVPEMLRSFGFPSDIAGQMRELLYGFVLVALMLYRPEGMLGEYKM